MEIEWIQISYTDMIMNANIFGYRGTNILTVQFSSELNLFLYSNVKGENNEKKVHNWKKLRV